MKIERAMGASSSSFLSLQSRFEEAPFDKGLQLDSSSASIPMPIRIAPAYRCRCVQRRHADTDAYSAGMPMPIRTAPAYRYEPVVSRHQSATDPVADRDRSCHGTNVQCFYLETLRSNSSIGQRSTFTSGVAVLRCLFVPSH